MNLYRHIFVLLGIALLTSCNKDVLDVDLSDHTETKIVGEGTFTDSLMHHQFKFTLSSNLRDTVVKLVNAVDLVVKTPEGDIPYHQIEDGIFESEIPFKGQYGEEYTIEFTYNDVMHEIETKMPDSIYVNEYDFPELDSSYSFASYPIEIGLNVACPKPQYMRFKLFKWDVNEFGDSTWNEIPHPVFTAAYVPVGDSARVNLPIAQGINQYNRVRYGDKVKLITYLISEDVGIYLRSLEKYVTSELLNSQFYNPPYYYSNRAYGLGYGTVIDTVIHHYVY